MQRRRSFYHEEGQPVFHIHVAEYGDDGSIKIYTRFFDDEEEMNLAVISYDEDPRADVVPCSDAYRDSGGSRNRFIVAALGAVVALALAGHLATGNSVLLALAVAASTFACLLVIASIL